MLMHFMTPNYSLLVGGFNEVFVLTFIDGTDIIARLNDTYNHQDDKQPRHLLAHRMASEVKSSVTSL